MTSKDVLQDAALNYCSEGLATLPVKNDKRPSIKSWAQYQQTKATGAEIRQWFSKSESTGVAIIAGAVSGNIEVLDVDCKYDKTRTLMADFCDLIKEHLPELFPRLLIAETVNKGFHILFRVPAESVEGNKKLASRPATDEEAISGDKVKVLIETRGEGGYVVAAPTSGYKWTQGSVKEIPSITANERTMLFTIARSFDQMPVGTTPEEKTGGKSQAIGDLSPFDDYDQRADVPTLLERFGWRRAYQRGERIHYKRPGTTDSATSGNFHIQSRLFYVFSTSTEFEAGRAYNPVQVYTQLEHGGNLSAASKALYVDGYGSRRKGKASDNIAEQPAKSDPATQFELTDDGVYSIDGNTKSEKMSQANKILQLAENIELFHTSDGEPFASIEVEGHFENHRVKSKSFRDYLSYQYYQTDGKSPSTQALQDATNSLSGKAKFEGKTQDVYIRLASLNGKIYLDLCNDAWQILEIGADGWRVIEAADAPVRFRRAKAMLALPLPTETGDISKLKSFLNVDDKNLTLILAWLVNCFRPDYPFPILLISGEQGTAKTTTSKLLKELVDPSVIPLRSAPRDEHNLVIAANNSWIVGLDNLSVVPDWLSDALCRLSTGGGFGTRTLYENDDETIFNAKRPIILNGIGDIASRSDLLDRALPVRLEAIPKNSRKTEREFWAEFEREKTSIFSALVSAVSSALGQIEKVKLEELPRMADFAFWATAAENGLGLKESDFIEAYTQNRENAHSIVLEDSLLAEVLQEFLTAKAQGEKYEQKDILLKEFLDQLKEVADAGSKERSKDKRFPKNPKGLRNAIERINPNLREIGIYITFHGRAGGNASKGASLSLEYDCNQTSQTSQTSQIPKNKGETIDVACDVTQNAQMSNITNATNPKSNVTAISGRQINGLASKSDVCDVSDVTLQLYSNDNDVAEFVDMEI